MLQYIYIKRDGDQERYNEFKNQLVNLKNHELEARFESALQCGIVGSHAQGLYLFALWKQGKDRGLRFATDPAGGLQITDGRIISLRPLI